MNPNHSREDADGDNHTGGLSEMFDPLAMPPFKLKDILHHLALEAVNRGDIASAISVARGDPWYTPPLAAMRLYEALFGFANEVASLSTLDERLPAEPTMPGSVGIPADHQS